MCSIGVPEWEKCQVNYVPHGGVLQAGYLWALWSLGWRGLHTNLSFQIDAPDMPLLLPANKFT